MKILVTGGAGFIGSHMVVDLLEAGHDVVSVDNYTNSSADVYERIERICQKQPTVVDLDLTNDSAMQELFKAHAFEAVFHFAALKSVGESVTKPTQYYRNNLLGMLNLLDATVTSTVKTFIFSSSATVYGDSESPISEDAPANKASNPYGWTKVFCEQMLRDVASQHSELTAVSLRYFNPIGAHSSGLIGELPKGTPANLVPYVAQFAAGLQDSIKVYGDDYDTPDGTGVRDYIHIEDLVAGHRAALEHTKPGYSVYNLGTGKGSSVLDVIKAFEVACGKELPYEILGRRPGDVAVSYASCDKAKQELGWQAEKTLEEACVDAWRWQQKL